MNKRAKSVRPEWRRRVRLFSRARLSINRDNQALNYRDVTKPSVGIRCRAFRRLAHRDKSSRSLTRATPRWLEINSRRLDVVSSKIARLTPRRYIMPDIPSLHAKSPACIRKYSRDGNSRLTTTLYRVSSLPLSPTISLISLSGDFLMKI